MRVNEMRTVILSGLICIAAWFQVSDLYAQSARELMRANRYTEAVRALLDGLAEPSSLSDDDQVLLGLTYMKRAYFLRSLAKLQVDVGLAYYLGRDTSQSVVKTSLNTYFVGRYLLAQSRGSVGQALARFRQVMERSDLSADYRQRARIWAGACEHLQGREAEAEVLWAAVQSESSLAAELAYARWWSGASAAGASQGASGDERTVSALRCGLWMALDKGPMEMLGSLQDALLDSLPADVVYRVDSDFFLRYYDPDTIGLQARADFILAADAFSHVEAAHLVDRARLYEGICALEGGKLQGARRAFEQSTQKKKEIYLGVLEFLEGRREQGEHIWKQALSGEEINELEWAGAVSRFPEKEDQIVALYEKYGKKSSANMSSALLLGRALLEIGYDREAFRVLDAAYPKLHPNELDKISPEYLTVLAHVKYRLGRRHYADVMAHLNALVGVYPVVLGPLDIAQGYMAPSQATGKKRTGG